MLDEKEAMLKSMSHPAKAAHVFYGFCEKHDGVHHDRPEWLKILKQISEHFDYSDKVYRDALALNSDDESLHEAIKRVINQAEGIK